MTLERDGLARSVQVRLARHAKGIGVDPNLVLTRYGLERYLYRLSRSRHAERFVLKGALLLLVWLGETLRPTRDADLLGFGELTDDDLLAIFREVCEATVEPDAATFDAGSVNVASIREGDAYGGRRITLRGRIGSARVSVQVDVGIGDAVTPDPEWLEYPSLLGFPRPRLRAYPRETVIAEKLHAMVLLGIRNSRMKDYFDMNAILLEGVQDDTLLSRAIAATFDRRKTALPTGVPPGLSDEFSDDAGRQAQWRISRQEPFAGSCVDRSGRRVAREARDDTRPSARAFAEGRHVTKFVESVVEEAALGWPPAEWMAMARRSCDASDGLAIAASESTPSALCASFDTDEKLLMNEIEAAFLDAAELTDAAFLNGPVARRIAAPAPEREGHDAMRSISTTGPSRDFAEAWEAAGRHLQRMAESFGLQPWWLRNNLEPPFLEHLSMRLGNQLIFIRLQGVDGPGSMDGVRAIARECEGHACVMPMKRSKSGWAPRETSWGLFLAPLAGHNDAPSRPFDPRTVMTDEEIEMTDWEVHDFAVSQVRQIVESREL